MQTYAQESTSASESTAVSAESVRDESSRGESLQRKASLANNAMQQVPASSRPNNTGLPDNLKSGVESLSGYSLDNVRVHYNSSKPASVQAYAYTRGTDIHIAPGREKYLPHEAWHVTQQMSGRVAPTTNVGGMPVNDDSVLEREADLMGSKALQCKSREGNDSLNLLQLRAIPSGSDVGQLMQGDRTYESEAFEYGPSFNKSVQVGTKMVAKLTKGDEEFNNGKSSDKNKDQDAMMADYRFRTQLEGNQLVKGHLLNEHLGGPADNKNLFPITDGANSKHLYFVENHVKELVLRNRRVLYSVNASPCDGMWNTECRKAKFECHYETIDSEPKQKKDVTIYSIIDKPTKNERGKATDKDGHELGKSEKNTRNGMNDELRKSSNKYNMCNVDEVKAFFDDVDELIADTVEILAFFLDVDDIEKKLDEIISVIDDLETLEYDILKWVFCQMGYDGYFVFLETIEHKPKIDDVIDPSNFIQYAIYSILNPIIRCFPEGQERADYVSKLNVDDFIEKIREECALGGMTENIEGKLSTVKDVLDKISVVTDNIGCILGDSSFEDYMSEMETSKKGRDKYKVFGKEFSKKVIGKIIKVADVVIKMLMFSTSVAKLITDPEERELLFENVVDGHFAPKVSTNHFNISPKPTGRTFSYTRGGNLSVPSRTQGRLTSGSYDSAYGGSYDSAYSSGRNQEKNYSAAK